MKQKKWLAPKTQKIDCLAGDLTGDLAGDLVAKNLYYCSKNDFARNVAGDFARDSRRGLPETLAGTSPEIHVVKN